MSPKFRFNKLRLLMLLHGTTDRDLAAAVGASATTIWRLRHGLKRFTDSNADVDLLFAICAHFTYTHPRSLDEAVNYGDICKALHPLLQPAEAA